MEKFLIITGVTDDFFEFAVDFFAEFFDILVASLHSANAMAVVKGRFLSTLGDQYIFSLTLSFLLSRINSY